MSFVGVGTGRGEELRKESLLETPAVEAGADSGEATGAGVGVLTPQGSGGSVHSLLRSNVSPGGCPKVRP